MTTVHATKQLDRTTTHMTGKQINIMVNQSRDTARRNTIEATTGLTIVDKERKALVKLSTKTVNTEMSNIIAVYIHIKKEATSDGIKAIKTTRIADIRTIVYPSVTEGRRWVRTLTKRTRAVRVATAVDKTTSLVRTSIVNGSPTTKNQARDNTSKREQTQPKDLT